MCFIFRLPGKHVNVIKAITKAYMVIYLLLCMTVKGVEVGSTSTQPHDGGVHLRISHREFFWILLNFIYSKMLSFGRVGVVALRSKLDVH